MKVQCIKCKLNFCFKTTKLTMPYVCRNCRAIRSIKKLMSISQNKINLITQSYQEGSSSVEIAKTLRISKFVVLKYLKKNNIPRRPPKYQHQNTIISPTEAAWLAGFIDGEGNVGVVSNKLKLTVSNANKDSIFKIRQLAGGGSINIRHNSKKNPKWSDIYNIKILGNSLRHIIHNISEYSIVKKEHMIISKKWYELLDNGQLTNNQKQLIKSRLQELARDGFKIKYGSY